MPDILMAPTLGGAFKGQNRISVQWPAQAGPYSGRTHMSLGDSIAVGMVNLDAAITDALANLAADDEKVTVVGLSGGALVVNEVLRQLAADAEAPGKDKITFVLVADSSRQKIIDKARYSSRYEYTYQPAPEVAYDVVVVTGEYDGMADFPDRWWNFLAVMNAVAGSVFMHVPTALSDLSKVPEGNITVDVNDLGGTTTHYLVPAQRLPLVLMMPWLASQEAALKAKVDKGYSRNDDKVAEARRLSAVAEVPAVVSESLATDVETEPVVESEPVVEAEPVVEEAVDAEPVRDSADREAVEADDAIEAELEQAREEAESEAAEQAREQADTDAGDGDDTAPQESAPQSVGSADSVDSSE